MKYKKTMILLVLAIFIFGVASVCASDVNETTIATQEDNQMELTLTEDEIQTNENDNMLTQTEDAEILTSGEGTYSDLRKDINSGNLTKSHYRYNDGDGDTIEINTPGVINGNGAVIDMAGSNIRAFYITASDVTINNLTIKNANYGGHGSAISFSTSGTVTNCNFTNNTANNGGAIRFSGSGTVSNCNFTDNTANYGGSVFFNLRGNVTNCNFINNTALQSGGAVFFNDEGTVSNCNFTGNTALQSGGAINVASGTVSNCNFTDNTANRDGGAVFFDLDSEVTNCNFINNKATGDGGGAIFFLNTGAVSNCNFTGNTAIGDGSGGAVYFNGKGDVSNCNFTGNTATGDGGAVYFYQGTGSVTNCNFTDNSARDGGAVRMSSGTVLNCNFTDNIANRYGGAVYFNDDGEVTNCNFTGNTATGDYSYGGAVYFQSTGTVSNCNFTDDSATVNGGAVYFYLGTGNVTNCNFTGNTASEDGGAVYFYSPGTVSNCNFTGNTAINDGGAVYFHSTGNVSNCKFTNNKATGDYSYGGAIRMSSGTVTNCNFTDNSATVNGGAVYFHSTGNVTNCNFTNNTADYAGAVYFQSTGTVSNCNFTGNNATTGSAIYFYKFYSSDTLTVSDSTFLNNRANAGALDIVKTENNITITFTGQNSLLNAIYSRDDAEVTFTNVTYWGAKGITTVSATMSGSNKATGQNITVGVVVNNELVLSDVIITNETGTIVLNISAGENYYISARHNTDSYYTEAERTISNNTKFNVNVTSQTTNNKTVNITAESNIPNDVVQGKLLFILPNNVEINATYGGNGTWWAVHTFDDYGVYQVNASYAGLTNVTITNATITINKLNSTVDISDVVLTYGETKNVTVTTEGATGIIAKINGNDVTVINNYTIVISGLAAGNYTLTVTTIPDGDYNPVNKTVNVTVNKAHTEITINTTSLELIVGDETIILATLFPDGAGNVTFTSSNKDIVEVDDKGNIIAQGKGQAIITVSFAGDNNYTAAENKTVTINVSLADASVTVDKSNVDLKVGETYAINPTKHPDTILLDITCKSSNNAVATVDKNGIVTAVGEGTAIITVEVGDDIFYAINSTNVTVTVSKIATDIASSAVTTVYNIEKNLIVTLKDADGKPISGAKITVDLNGAKTYTTDKNGQVKVSTKGLAPKAYTAKVTFNGNTNYDKSTKDIKVTVKKATPKLTAKKKTFKTTPKTKKYTIVLKDNTGKAIKKAKVTLKVKGKTYKATTNSKGKATFKITKLNKKGTFKATITYKGNKYYNKISKKAKIKVIVTFKTVSKGSKDKATVKEIQQALKDKGYYLTYQGHYLKVDGKFNSCTFRSIKEFQKDKGLKVTGKVDEKTAKKLGIL